MTKKLHPKHKHRWVKAGRWKRDGDKWIPIDGRFCNGCNTMQHKVPVKILGMTFHHWENANVEQH